MWILSRVVNGRELSRQISEVFSRISGRRRIDISYITSRVMYRVTCFSLQGVIVNSSRIFVQGNGLGQLILARQ